MPRQCIICGKKGRLVWRVKKLRGKYNPTVKRRQKVNLQQVKIPKDIKKEPFRKFAGKRILMCTKCRKTMLKQK